MRQKRGEYRGTGERRREILDAALACFSEAGFVETTMEDIRLRSGASHGSIYHHFGGKEQLAAALYVQCVEDYQAGFAEALARQGGAREGIAAAVRYHLQWVGDHAELAGYLMRMRHAEFMAPAETALAASNQAFAAALATFFRQHVARGVLRSLPREICISLLLGPAQELVRQWLTSSRPFALEPAAAELADAAWRALSTGEPAPRPREDARKIPRKQVNEPTVKP